MVIVRHTPKNGSKWQNCGALVEMGRNAVKLWPTFKNCSKFYNVLKVTLEIVVLLLTAFVFVTAGVLSFLCSTSN